MAWWPTLPSPLFYLAMLLVSLGLCLFGLYRGGHRGPKVSLIFLGWVLGFCWCGLAAHVAMADRWPSPDRVEVSSRDVHWVEGHVVGLPSWSDDSLRFEFDTADPEFPSRLLVRWHRPNVYIAPGQQWHLPLRMDPPQGRLNFGGFDYEQYLLAEGIGGLARVNTSQGQPTFLGEGDSVGYFFDRRRQVMAENIQATTTHLEVASLKRALLIGDRSTISDGVREILQQTGTAHLLAISGLHVGMVAGLGMAFGWVVWIFLALFQLQVSRRVVMVVTGWGVGFAYAGLAGFSLPTQRAVLMLGVVAVAFLWHRRIMPFDALLMAGFVVLVLSPLSVLSVGFWLSFVAVVFLIWGFAWRIKPRTHFRGVRALVAAQLILAIGLLPLNVGLFGQWSPSAFVANLVAIPWVGSVVLPTLLLSAIMEGIGWSVPWLAWIGDEGLAWLMVFLRRLSEFRGGHHTVAFGSAPSMVLALIGAAWLLAPPGWPGRWLGLSLMAPLLLGAMVSGASPPNRLLGQGLTLSVLDVGSGLAVMAETEQYRLLYDTGPGDGLGRDSIGDVLKHWPRLHGSRTHRLLIDDLVVSHAHSGHRGGLGAIKEWAWVRRAHVPKAMGLDPWLPIGDVLDCRRGQQWVAGLWTFEFVHPGEFLPDLGGNSGCVLWIHSDTTSVLLNGGLDAIGEAHVSTMVPDLKADVLIIGRSGHTDTTSNTWLEQLNPRLGVISVSVSDAYGRPSDDVLARLDASGVKALTTSRCRAMRLVIHPLDPEIQVTTVAGLERRFWRDESQC
ncbi:MAG TPA: DNA internalization-related competence protein ComEC/Rec2 [Wenzhouxiangella sp.]